MLCKIQQRIDERKLMSYAFMRPETSRHFEKKIAINCVHRFHKMTKIHPQDDKSHFSYLGRIPE